MRFTANGPAIPDELLVARDAGDVIFFCGAGVSRHEADLPDFATLADAVIRSLGAAQDSLARTLLAKARSLGTVPGIGGLVATDRVFSLLEREFETSDVRAAVAEALRPMPDPALGAHRTVLDLATTGTGTTRLVTTNFDLLFEACRPDLPSVGPPNLPDPRREPTLRGIVHLHGRVDQRYKQAADETFVVLSADFGRAYLAEGWATSFIQALIARFTIVFVGYAADDPPMQYLLEALNPVATEPTRLFAFQEGERSAATALWEQRGVRAIPFDGFGPLWRTLEAWADRARDVTGWHDRLIERAAAGPRACEPYTRGQVAHMLSTVEGAQRVASSENLLGAEWLLVADPRQRYATPLPRFSADAEGPFDPFPHLTLDDDQDPEPSDLENVVTERKVPEDALDALQVNRFDRTAPSAFGRLQGGASARPAPLPARLGHLATWFIRAAHQPAALWWAAHQGRLHPVIVDRIAWALRQEPQRFPPEVRRGWRFLFAAWRDGRPNPDQERFEIEARAASDGWSPTLVRELAALYRPQLTVKPGFHTQHPLAPVGDAEPDRIVHVDVAYPRPHGEVGLPDTCLRTFTTQLRQNLELAIALEREVTGCEWLYLTTTRPDEEEPDLREDDSYGLTAPVLQLQNVMARLARIKPDAARAEARSWPTDDAYVFARLRIWAAGSAWLPAAEAAATFLSLSDRAFWSSVHQRDLLYAFKDRWSALSAEDRLQLEARLLTSSFPWDADVPGGPEHAAASERLNRLHWLSRHGIAFSAAIAAAMAALRVVVPDWTTEEGDGAARSTAPEAYGISVDDDPAPVSRRPLAEILPAAEAAGRRGWGERVELAPFRGLAREQPARAFAALSHAARNGRYPFWAWSVFLSADTRVQDPLRLVRVIAGRVQRLPDEVLREIAGPAADWMERLAPRWFRDAALSFPLLWDRLIGVLARPDGDEPPPRTHGWTNAALNAPTGRLFNLLMKDPCLNGLPRGEGFPEHWTMRLDQLLALPGELRCQALVMISFQLNWLHVIDPSWTERQLLGAAADTALDGEAVWEGVLWAAKVPPPPLYVRLKPALMRRARLPRHQRHQSTIVGGFLLYGWGGFISQETPDPLVSNEELREVLIHTDDELRGQLLWQLERWVSDDASPWSERLLPFLRDVWPNQRTVRTPANSARLASLAIASGDLMPAVVDLIRKKLVLLRGGSLRGLFLAGENAETHPARKHPKATLDLLWSLLGENPSDWPYNVTPTLDFLLSAAETTLDPRLAELLRRLRSSLV